MRNDRQIVMARKVAQRWIASHVKDEHRFRVFSSSKEVKNLPILIRSFRDKKAKLEGVTPITDLGICENFDYMELWSTNHDALVELKDWFERSGFETTGIW